MNHFENNHESLQEQVLQNINQFLEEEGYRKDRLAKKMGKSTSAFYAHLQGKHPKTVFQFATELAIVLGYHQAFFLEHDFVRSPKLNENPHVVYSKGNLSKKGEEGLEEISKLCDLIEVYF